MEKILSTTETKILKFIIYAPMIFILLLSIVLTNIMLINHNDELKRDITNIHTEYMNYNMSRMEDEVNNIYQYIQNEQLNSLSLLKESLKKRVYEAHDIASNIYEVNKNTKSKQEILKLIKDALRNIRFNEGRGYYFMDDINGKIILNPLHKYLENKNIIDIEDEHGYKYVETISKVIKNKSETFDEYYWEKPNDSIDIYKKVTFYKHFAPYDLILGTGEYEDEYNDNLQKRILDYISTVRFGENRYFFVVNYAGVMLSHFNQEFVNSNTLELKDKNNIYYIKELIDIAKNGSGFLTYIGPIISEEKKVSDKTTYVIGYDNWNWAVGTGFYNEELKKQVSEKIALLRNEKNEKLVNIFTFAVVLTIILLLISMYVSNILQKRFLEYRRKVEKEIEGNRKKDTILFQQSKMASMGEMISNISHQWRQPLSIISTVASGVSLKKEMNTLDDQELMDSMEKITDSTMYLSETIEDFRDFFNPNKSVMTFCLEDLLKRTIKLMHSQFKNEDIEIIQNVPYVEITSYENELLQVLINILNNSRDELLKLKSKRLIFVTAVKKKDNVIIKVLDNGNGIDNSIIQRIFEPYFTTKHKSLGTGIGLYMCQEIISKHMNGEISVSNVDFNHENISYRGSEFKITLPLDCRKA